MYHFRPELAWYHLYWMDESLERQGAPWYDCYWVANHPRHQLGPLNSDLSTGWWQGLVSLRPAKAGTRQRRIPEAGRAVT
jgi:hypothetical protein